MSESFERAIEIFMEDLQDHLAVMEVTMNRLIAVGSFERVQAVNRLAKKALSSAELLKAAGVEDEDIAEIHPQLKLLQAFIELELHVRLQIADAIANCGDVVVDPDLRIKQLVGNTDEWESAIDEMIEGSER